MLDIQKGGPITTLTIRRPERRNALNAELVARLVGELESIAAAGKTSAVVLTAAAPGFCAGSDLKELAGKTLDEMKQTELIKGRLVETISNIAPPVIAAVEGFALGGGFALATCCDFVVTAGDTRWHMPEALNGWIPPWGIEAIKLRVGHYRARQLVCGWRLDGHQAVAAGVADLAVAPGEALSAASVLAAQIAESRPHVLDTIKRYFAEGISGDMRAADNVTAELFKQNCRVEPALATLSRFGVKNA